MVSDRRHLNNSTFPWNLFRDINWKWVLLSRFDDAYSLNNMIVIKLKGFSHISDCQWLNGSMAGIYLTSEREIFDKPTDDLMCMLTF